MATRGKTLLSEAGKIHQYSRVYRLFDNAADAKEWKKALEKSTGLKLDVSEKA